MPIVLCVDDNKIGLASRKLLLESQGYSVVTAADGLTALSMLRESKVDAVVLDYRMPGMDGETVGKLIREQNPAMPIILLTGFPADLPKDLTATVDAVVTKGQSAEVLLRTLVHVIGARPLGPRKFPPETANAIEAAKNFLQEAKSTIAESRALREKRKRET